MSAALLRSAGRLAASAGAVAAACAVAAGPAVVAAEAKGSAFAPTAFDPEALERGAKALREISRDANAKKVLELTQQQEKTKEAEEKTKQAEFAAAQAQFNVEREKVQWEEQRKTMQQQASQKAQLAQYEDELARKRMSAEHESARQRNAETVAMQEESTRKQEALRAQTEAAIQAERRITDERKADLDKDVVRAKALAEAEGRAQEARLNEDVNRRALADRLEAQGKQAMAAIDATFKHLGSGAMALLTDRQKLGSFVAGATALALGVFGARESARVAGRVAERMLGTPPLVRESSRRRMLGLLPGTGLRDAAGSGGAAVAATSGAGAQSPVLRDVVLAPAMETRLQTLANFTASARRHGVPFRHMLYYGPPGTGKTLAARQMARYSGLEYAVLSGGDVAPLGGDAVTQLHAVFDWAEASSKGVLLFVDEADAFLRRRDTANVSEGVRAALNVMLSRTGGASKDFVLVLATNRPEDLDEAVLDRTDEVLEFGLPDMPEREKMLNLFMQRYLTNPVSTPVGISGMLKGVKAAADPVTLVDIDDGEVSVAASQLDGFSGRELEKVVIAMQAAAYGAGKSELTRDAFRAVVAAKVAEKEAKREFVSQHNLQLGADAAPHAAA